jgi:23S rRNA G2069 N7-methylase RlmK/C1962 C5-methylase RlmI
LPEAVKLARENATLNQLNAEFVEANAFEWLETADGMYDTILLDPPAIAKTSAERDALKLLRAVFDTIARDIDQTADGPYQVPGLGSFHVRTVEADAEGEPGGRKVVFRTKKPKAPAAP